MLGGRATAAVDSMAHKAIGLPLPAVYIPQRTLPPSIKDRWAFELIRARDAQKPIPFARNGDNVLAADIRSQNAMSLLIVPAVLFTGTGVPGVAESPVVLVNGRFTDPHPREWKQAAYTAGALLAAIGPDESPCWIPPNFLPGDPSEVPAAERQAIIARALGSLWIFHSAIAGLHLVMPDPPDRRRWRGRERK